MATVKITLSLDADTLAASRDLAERSDKSLSAWLSDAARARVLDESARAAGALFAHGGELLDALRGASHARAAALAETGA